ncbi:hypothetical protein V5D56_19460 [Cellulosimicrobium sp. PMB13]|uniref:hypothetical protein n=1 Tax=Cellulosimicrobium sp. PMB13 TaxID=3120158 RepID=UPI003F4BA298
MTTSPSTRPSPGVPDGAPEAPDEKAPEAPKLSLTQMIASALAAVSTTVLLSYFGIAGTIIGAGAASVITVVANYAYTRSIQKTHEQLKPVVSHLAPRARGGTARLPAVPRGDDTQPLHRPRTDAADDTATAVPRGSVPADDAGTSSVTVTAGAPPRTEDDAGSPDDDARPGPWFRLIDRYGTGKVLAVSAAALFVVVMGVVLVVELAIGKPISDAVRGQEGSGTSISRTTTADDEGTGTGTVTPSQELPDGGTTTPTPDPAAPTDDATELPTDEPSDAPTEVPTDEPTDPATPTPEPTEPTTPGTGETGGTDPTGGGTGTGGTETGADAGSTGGPGGSSGGTGTGGTTGSSAEPAPATSGAPGA